MLLLYCLKPTHTGMIYSFMKKTILLIAVLLNGLLISAQTLTGTYKNGADSLQFTNDHVTFYISGFGGLSSAQVGEGKYEIVDNYMLVHTSEYSGNKTTFQELGGSKNDTCVVKIVGLNNYSIKGVLVESKNKSGKTISAGVSDNEGKVFLINNEKSVNIGATAMGYNSIEIDYNSGNDYLIKLAENDVIEDKSVVLRFNEIDEETISILLLTDNFNTDKKQEDELKKLEKRARKNNRIDKLYKREYEPFNDFF